jgi:hypothetical protein
MTDNTSSQDSIEKDRSLSEDFQSRSPNTQMYVRFYTGGKTPSSKVKKTVSHNFTNYGDVSPEVSDILIQYGLIADNRTRYTRHGVERHSVEQRMVEPQRMVERHSEQRTAEQTAKNPHTDT